MVWFKVLLSSHMQFYEGGWDCKPHPPMHPYSLPGLLTSSTQHPLAPMPPPSRPGSHLLPDILTAGHHPLACSFGSWRAALQGGQGRLQGTSPGVEVWSRAHLGTPDYGPGKPSPPESGREAPAGLERAPGSEWQQRGFTPHLLASRPRALRPPGLKASRPIPNVYLDRFFRFKAFTATSLSPRVGPVTPSPGGGWGRLGSPSWPMGGAWEEGRVLHPSILATPELLGPPTLLNASLGCFRPPALCAASCRPARLLGGLLCSLGAGQGCRCSPSQGVGHPSQRVGASFLQGEGRNGNRH